MDGYRSGMCKTIAHGLPVISESLFLVGNDPGRFNSEDIYYQINKYDFTCVNIFETLISQKNLDEIKQEYIDEGYEDVSVQVSRILMGRMSDKQRMICSKDSYKPSYKKNKRILFNCDLMIVLDPIYYLDSDKDDELMDHGSFKVKIYPKGIPAYDDGLIYSMPGHYKTYIECGTVSNLHLFNECSGKNPRNVVISFNTELDSNDPNHLSTGITCRNDTDELDTISITKFIADIPDTYIVAYDIRYKEKGDKREVRTKISHSWIVLPEYEAKTSEYLLDLYSKLIE